MAQTNEARELAIAIGNVIADAPDEAKPILVVWQAMARKAAARIDELNEFNAAASVPLIGGGRMRFVKSDGVKGEEGERA